MKRATFRQMEVFETVARHLNYSRAAEQLRLSQPAVSIHVKQLEGYAGLPLFEQLGKRIYLTRAGHEMLHYSRAVLQQVKEAEEALAALKGIHGGLLNIAVISAGDYFFPGLLAEFCRRHDNVTVQLSVNNREEIVRQLVENTTNLAVLLRPPGHPNMIAEAFAPQPHVIIAAPGHALARERHISLQALANEAFIVRERGSDTRLAMEEMLAEFRVKFNIAMEIKSTETIKQAVIAGMGIGFLSAHTIGRDLEAGRLSVLDVEGFPVMREWHIVHRRNKRLPAVAVAFKQFLLQEGAALIERLVGRVTPRRKRRA